MPVPSFRLVCCLCGKPIPLTQDVYALDAEWQRRFPAMRGILASRSCALSAGWSSCEVGYGIHADGHIPARGRCDVDARSHVLGIGTHAGMVQRYPGSALLQGAEPCLRHLAQRTGVAPTVAVRLHATLEEWDATAKADRGVFTGSPAPGDHRARR